MPGQKYISASCSVVHGIVRKNDKVLYKEEGSPVNDFLLSAYKQLGIDYPKFYKMDSLSKLGFLATEVLLKENMEKGKYTPEETGIVFANRNASLDADLNYWESVKNIPSPALFVYTLPNIIIGEICIRHNFKGENAFFVQEQFDIPFIEFYVNDLMDRHNLAACICGWIDIVGEEYAAIVYLVEKEGKENPVLFTKENINHIYEIANG
ncbi:MAG: hypothetical protein JSS70_20070 [Bacteroidetes bacterium]|nr:hypothetical protein [Bacteroidota bacterium]